MNRIDFKFALTGSEAICLLKNLGTDYNLISKDESLFRDYETTYYDTSNKASFIMHHNGKLPRFKIRTRTYIDTNDQFFEFKYKNNKGRTEKKRLKLISKENLFEQTEVIHFLNEYNICNLDEFQEVLHVKYKRISLQHKKINERVTLDFDMSFHRDNKKIQLGAMVLVEVKQEKQTKSTVVSLLKSLNKHSQSISKYCLGLLKMEPFIKHNNFNPLLKGLKKLNKTA